MYDALRTISEVYASTVEGVRRLLRHDPERHCHDVAATLLTQGWDIVVFRNLQAPQALAMHEGQIRVLADVLHVAPEYEGYPYVRYLKQDPEAQILCERAFRDGSRILFVVHRHSPAVTVKELVYERPDTSTQ